MSYFQILHNKNQGLSIKTSHLMTPIIKGEEEDNKGKTTGIIIAGRTHLGARWRNVDSVISSKEKKSLRITCRWTSIKDINSWEIARSFPTCASHGWCCLYTKEKKSWRTTNCSANSASNFWRIGTVMHVGRGDTPVIQGIMGCVPQESATDMWQCAESTKLTTGLNIKFIEEH